MKNLSLILNGLLIIAIIILFVLLGKKQNKTQDLIQIKDSASVVNLPIAYVNIDSLLLNYTFAKNANEALTRKQEDSRVTLNSRQRELQEELVQFNKKLENNAFLSRERAEQEQLRLQKKQQDLQEMAGRLSDQIMAQQQKMSEQLRDTINTFLKEYNKDGRYQMIISNTANDNVLFAEKKYDITEDVIKKLNARFKSK